MSANEGAVLLKNEDDALPLAADETGNKITNLFEDVDINYYSEYTYLSRSD